MSFTVLYAAAHGGFSNHPVPLGGGAAVCDHLVEEWTRTRPFPLKLITPASLGAAPGSDKRATPSGRELVQFGERDYARFSRAFERAATEEILRHDPATSVVLANDVSEGPDFETLAARGYRMYTIYHVDVVAYVAAMYLRGWVRPETTVRWYPRLRGLLPAMARLVWEKQEASVRFSRGLIMPSEGMREVMLRCYPSDARDKIQVLPWGSWSGDLPPAGPLPSIS